MANQRTGKIARAPFTVRTRVNEMLRDGSPYGVIIKYLESVDIFGITEPNITRWQQGGHQDWLAERSKLDELRARQEFAMEIAEQNKGSVLHEAGLHLAASQIYETLSEFDTGNLKELLAEKPENYAQLVNGLAKLSKGALDLRKYQDAVTKAKEEIQKLRDPKQSLGDDERKAIVDKVDEILGLK